MQHVVYQIYPRSFSDANGDGVGDLRGIINKLDYIAALGVDTIWLSPMFPSPMVDNGYDISDYKNVDPQFGTLEDLQELIDEAKARGMGILLDLVLNHSSSEHAWFKAALADKNSPYRDYYIFKETPDGQPPNNWRSNFGGSAWEPDGTGAYYLHTFAKEQPDLNWESPAMRKELVDMICWWLEKGVAGFRIDAISFIKKNPLYPSLPPDAPDGLAWPGQHWLVHPGIGAFLAQLRDEAFAPYGAYTVAEANGLSPQQLKEYIGENGYFSAVFDFSYTDIDLADGNWHTLREIDQSALREAIFASQRAVCEAGHGAVYFENHDQLRSPNKYLAPQEINRNSITMLGVLYFFLQGTAYVYQGQELGVCNYPWQSMHQFDDVSTHDQYARAVAEGFSQGEAFRIVAHRSRDNARVPLQWSEGADHGFGSEAPWLPVAGPWQEQSYANAAQQERDEASVLHFYRRMAALRRGAYAQLFYDGSFAPALTENASVFAYRRALEENKVLVVCNFSSQETTVTLPSAKVLLGNLAKEGAALSGETALRPFEALVLLEA